MILCGSDTVKGQRMIGIGLGADAALILECQFEDGIDMPFVCRGLVVPMGQFRARRHACTTITGINKAKTVICRRVSGLGMRCPDGNRFAEFPLANGNDTVRDRCVGGAVDKRSSWCRRRQQYCRAQGHGNKPRPFAQDLAAVDLRSEIRNGCSEQGHDLSPFAMASGQRCAIGADIIGRLRPRLERSGK